MADQAEIEVLEATGLIRTFGACTVLDSVDLRLLAGRVVTLRGSNGAGKSTLLECLAGAQPLDGGKLSIDGAAVEPESRLHWTSVHAILDDFAWFADLTVLDHYRLLAPGLRRAEFDQIMGRLGVSDLADRLPDSLSAGQRQRCALLSAAVRPWRVLLLDEPERHLSAEVLPAVGKLLEELAGVDRAVLAATHAADALGLDSAPALVVQDGRVEVMS